MNRPGFQDGLTGRSPVIHCELHYEVVVRH